MIDQLYYCMLETTIQLNVHFIRDALKEVQNIMMGLLKNDSLMENFIIPQPLSTVEVSYQAIQMDSTYLDTYYDGYNVFRVPSDLVSSLGEYCHN